MRGTEANKNPEPSRGLERIQKGRDSWRRRRDCAAAATGPGAKRAGECDCGGGAERGRCVSPLWVPLVPCRRCRSLVGRGFGQRRSVLPQRVFTPPRIGVCFFSLHRFYRHQHRRLYFTVLHLSFTSVGVCTSAVCTRPMTERTVGSTARNVERREVARLSGGSLLVRICSGRVGFRTPPDVRP